MRKTGGGSGGTVGGSEGSSSSEEKSGGTSAKRRSFPRFSLRRLLHPSPLLARRFLNAATGGASVAAQQVCQQQQPAFAVNHLSATNGESSPGETTKSHHSEQSNGGAGDVKIINTTSGPNKSEGNERIECSLCFNELAPEHFPQLVTCSHKSCYDCLQVYLRIEISESRVSVSCPQCAEAMHPNDIRMILNDKTQYEKYEDFMIRRVLAGDPDTRWCPAPDCSYAVIASGCASCPKIKCEREGCGSYFCYHCKAGWHPNQTCDAARAQRSPNVRSSSLSFSQDSHHRDDMKLCPRCQALIVKMDDGSCNHMNCTVCKAEFCWLCMKEISDLHYLSPSGCTFWGKKPWSRKKKILWQLGTLVGAPVGIGLVAGIAVPAIIIGIPVWVGRKIYARYKQSNKHKRNLAIAGGVSASVLISPILAGLAVGIGVPILLFYVYGVVPVSLCRSGGCGVSTSGAGVRFEFDDEPDVMGVLASKTNDGDTVSHPGGNPSIGEVSLSLGSGSQLEREADRESASFVALAGSIASNTNTGQRLEVLADVVACQRFSVSSETASAATSISDKTDAASTRGLAGSPLNFKTEGGSLSNYRGASNDSSGSAPETTSASATVVPNDLDTATVNSLEELATGLLRKVTKKNKLIHKDDVEDGCLDRVRFDDNVSFIDPQLDDAPHCLEDNDSIKLSKHSHIRIDLEDMIYTNYCFSHYDIPGTSVESINEARYRSEITSLNNIADRTQMEDAGLRNSYATFGKSDSEQSSTTSVPATSSSSSNVNWDENASSFYKRIGGTRKNKYIHKDDVEDGCSDRVRFDDNVSFIDPQLDDAHGHENNDSVKPGTSVESINETRHRNELISSNSTADRNQTDDAEHRISSTYKKNEAEYSSTTIASAPSSSSCAVNWDENASSFYRKIGGTRKNKYGVYKEEMEDVNNASERVRFEKNVSYIDRQLPTSSSALHRKLDDGPLTSKPSLRSLFFQQITDPPQPRGAASLDGPQILPTIPEPVDSITISISD